MREIKFKFVDEEIGIISRAYTINELAMGHYQEGTDVDKMVNIQYTDFDDKEGEEIYHHDILAFDAKEWYGMNYVDGMEDYLFEVDKSISGEWIGAGLCTEWPTYCKRICSKFERPDLIS